MTGPNLRQAAHAIAQLPTQYHYLHAMIGEHSANPNPTRTQPESTVLINVVIDSLLDAIHYHVTLAAGLVADALNVNNPYHHDRTLHVHACCALIAPNLAILAPLTDVDVMEWDGAGTNKTVSLTSGAAVITELERLAITARYTLGWTKARTYRDIPCARCAAKTVGRWAGNDYYDCETCGTHWQETEIRLHDRILLERHRRGLMHASA